MFSRPAIEALEEFVSTSEAQLETIISNCGKNTPLAAFSWAFDECPVTKEICAQVKIGKTLLSYIQDDVYRLELLILAAQSHTNFSSDIILRVVNTIHFHMKEVINKNFNAYMEGNL